ncbi:pilus assembly protein [Xanthomonas hortorum pv. gardneri]|uniref:pilus assembly protein n=1 Tax=Xanthomonas hortorum TaxID=56454 RepID=UPI001E3D9041|nr:PilC/PilY family type IV pilus protein [Xanthomonas hortorum]MCC8493102.1 pilus assembly protein [Xanthomonas hortorum pv. gardneri]MCE4528011.1 pilus assembly protein [Xanthomonas hortorum pv. vitians]
MSHRIFRTAVVSVIVFVAVGGYFIYSLIAAQGQGALAQSPLNNATSVSPAFIMAVDDSNSMTFERIFRGGDGRLRWNGTSFFSSAGVFFNASDACTNTSADCYLYLYSHVDYNKAFTPGDAIPPIDVFGFARSPTYNASYYNPDVLYEPWLLPAKTGATAVSWPPATFGRARVDPRDPQVYGSDFNTGYNTIYNLGSREVDGESFQFLTGMTIAAGTRYKSNARSCNTFNNLGFPNNDGLPSSGGNWINLTAGVRVAANCLVQISYVPATFYLPVDAPAPVGYRTNDVNRPIIANACGPGCSLRRYQILLQNYETSPAAVIAYGNAQQNFANWFQYHRNRILAVVGSASRALAGVDKMRIGYFTINNLAPVTMYDVFNDDERASLYGQIYRLKPSGGTPNRTAVDYLGKQFLRTGDGAPVLRACQKNGGMLFTDGYSNINNVAAGYGNADSTGTVDFPALPFADSYENTIADIAASYYAGASTPLVTGQGFQAGLVPVDEKCATLSKSSSDWKRLDCQKDLHMNFYAITLGAQGNIFEVNQAATDDPYSNAPDWNANGDPKADDDGRVIDELWHATINSRGEFINAKSPAEVAGAMRRVLSAAGAPNSPSGTLALTGARIGAGSLTVAPEYQIKNNGTDWSSKLKATQVSVDPDTREARFTPFWEASAQIAQMSLTARNVFFNDGNNVRKFDETTITLSGLCGLSRTLYPGQTLCLEKDLTDLEATASTAAGYLLGDQSGEVQRNGRLRDRTTVLGDIINSAPLISSPIDDFGYRALGGTLGTAYTSYLNSKRANQSYMVYAGANDGMLHAFDGGMNGSGSVTGSGGRERFAYIPATSYGHMGNLLLPYQASKGVAPSFDHRYFVDGPLAVGDAYYNGGWKTTLVGTTGAGGRGAFALDITNPSAFGSASRLWEINDLSGDATVRSNIGHVLGKPVIVPVRAANGAVSWKAIFGNGYDSASGKTVLFVVDIGTSATPTVRMIEATESSNTISGRNGLGNVIVLDRVDNLTIDQTTGRPAQTRDGYADTVYAADLRGAVWKFDLTSTAASVTVPAFTTGTYTEGGRTYRQPITGGLQASSGENGGVLVLFGTGSFSFDNDSLASSVLHTQSLYGFTDQVDGVIAATLTRANLTPYSVTIAVTGGTRTLLVGNAPATALGWYVDLPAGERFVGYPELVSGILFMPTYAPLAASSGCSTDGVNWLFGLNPRTGVGALSGVRMGGISGSTLASGSAGISLNTGGNSPIKDVGVSVVPRLEPKVNPKDGSAAPAVPAASGCWMVVNVAGAAPMYVPYPCGRQSWRQIQ